MSGGGSRQQQPQTQVVEQKNIPDYLKPFITDVAGKAQAEANRPYQPYQGQKIAGFDPMQTKAFEQIGAMQRPGGIWSSRGYIQ